MADLGPPYDGDSPFKANARRHQSLFRSDFLGDVGYREWGNRLVTESATAGKIFYDGYDIFSAAKRRFPFKDQKLYWDLLASDNVPFNFFAPLEAEPALAAALCREWTGLLATEVEVRFEWAPDPDTHLGDKTSFDAYLAYRAEGIAGAIGIEVKYTEGEYRWGDSEQRRMLDPLSQYNLVHDRSGGYITAARDALCTTRLKQFWRNSLLGEAMLQRRTEGLERFTSLLLYPSGNKHFDETAQEYAALLAPANRSRFAAVTYEGFIATCRRLGPGERASRWLDYLERRYIAE